MKKLKATPREKEMDSAITDMRRPYDYKETKRKLDEAAEESHEYLSKLRKISDKKKSP